MIVNGIFYVIGQGFIRLMQMLVVPLVFCSLVCGSMAIGDTRRLGKVGMKTIAFYLLTTAIAITVAILLASLINPGTGLDMGRIETTETAVGEKLSMADTLLQIIPTNPLGALASGEMLPIILFALIIGVILAHRGEKADTVSSFFSQFNDIMMDMTCLLYTSGGLRSMPGRFFEAEVFESLTEEETEAFDKGFPYMEKLRLPGQWDYDAGTKQKDGDEA